MNIKERKDMHKAIGLILCFSGMFFAVIGVYIEEYTWYLFAIAGVFVVIMIYHNVKYWGPALEEYKESKHPNVRGQNR